MGLNDRALIIAAQSGNVDAYGHLVKRYERVAFHVAYVITGSVQDAEEAAQDGFIRAFFAIDRFRVDAEFRPWLLAIVANCARSRRSSSVRHFSFAIDEIMKHSLPDRGATLEEIAIANDDLRRVLTLLNQMQPDDREVITGRYFLDLTEEELSASLLIPRGTVKSRLSRALARLRTSLNMPGADND